MFWWFQVWGERHRQRNASLPHTGSLLALLIIFSALFKHSRVCTTGLWAKEIQIKRHLSRGAHATEHIAKRMTVSKSRCLYSDFKTTLLFLSFLICKLGVLRMKVVMTMIETAVLRYSSEHFTQLFLSHSILTAILGGRNYHSHFGDGKN